MIIKKHKNNFSLSWKGLALTLVILLPVTLAAFFLQRFDYGDTYVPMMFIMAVFLIARYTDGYLYGVFASVFGVFLVNYSFTYPYFEFNFTISGYPITFISMFVISVMTSAMTTRIKTQESFRIEAEKEKLRANLLRSVSHDLRTPLTSILGTTSALIESGDKIPPEKQLELLRDSHDDAEWLIRMVENLLSVTKMNTGEAKIKKKAEAAEEIVGEAVRKFNKRFPAAEVKVSVPQTLLMVPMDAILIEQVLINLLENAVLHGKSMMGIRMIVKKNEDYAVFMVHDSGVGIQDNMLEHLFDGYIAGTDERESESKRNMGIGLSVCMSIVKAHGGNLHAENKPEGGAVFTFSLPLSDEAQEL